MSNTVQQRDAFFNKLYEIAKKDKNVILVVADMSAQALDKFRVELPNQFINVGIAEQNAIAIANGLSLTGKKVYVYAIASFMTLRCLEQIRVSNGIMGIPITVIGMGTGFSYCYDGPTHHLIEDIAIYRAMPNITIANITDSVMAEKYVNITYKQNKFYYIRLDKDVTPILYAHDFDFYQGFSITNSGKSKNVIITGGVMTASVLEVVNDVDPDILVIDVYELPILGEKLLEVLKNTNKIITIEEHFISGGLGSAVLEYLNDYNYNVPIKRMAIDMNHGYQYSYNYGGREEIRKQCHIDKASLVVEIQKYFN